MSNCGFYTGAGIADSPGIPIPILLVRARARAEPIPVAGSSGSFSAAAASLVDRFRNFKWFGPQLALAMARQMASRNSKKDIH
jgi:hypothetical protein